jgi:hypothetical protein
MGPDEMEREQQWSLARGDERREVAFKAGEGTDKKGREGNEAPEIIRGYAAPMPCLFLNKQ